MKLLIVSDAWQPQVNGVVRTYEHLSEELSNMGHDVQVIGPSAFPLRLPMPGYAEIELALAPYGRLKKMIDALEPDHIHIATEGPLGYAGRKYCLKNAHAFTTSYHTHFPDYVAKRLAKFIPALYKPVHNITKSMIRDFHAPARAMMVATQSLEDELNAWGFKTPKHRLTRGAKLDQFYPGEKTVFTGLKGPIAIYVGRVAIEKNIEDFLNMDWEGTKVIVGEGPSLSMLKKRYPEAVFTGKKLGAELAAYYRSSDVFVFPSKTDTFGIVLIEALASGVPIAGYAVTGPKDIITQPFLGAMHDTDLGKAAREAMRCGTPEQRAAHVKSTYTWENAARQFEDAVKEANETA